MIKARPVAGDQDEGWVASVNQAIEEAVFAWQAPRDLHKKIHHLRMRKEKEIAKETGRVKNIKEGFGGLLDVKFLTQYLQLLYASKYPALKTAQTFEALNQMRDVQVLDSGKVEALIKSYRFLRLLESFLRLLFDKSTNEIDFEKMPAETLTGLLHLHGYPVQEIEAAYKETTETVRKIYLDVLLD